MATSTLSETDTGTYIDRDGDIVFVFTDKDGKNKSLILQGGGYRGFGIFARMSDGYYKGDYSPYLPVRLFLTDIKHPDRPTYDFEEIEQNEEYDGAWIGDQGTLILHRSDNDQYRMLHVMFTYDSHHELKFVRYNFSPIFNRFPKEEKFRSIMEDERLTIVTGHTRETFRDKLDDIQNQIDQMGEQISSALSFAQTAQTTADSIASRVSTLEEETKPESNARDTPDSEGFWRDSDGDVWVRDARGTTLLIAKGYKQGDNELYNLPSGPESNFDFSFVMHECGPYVKIDNPFIQGEDHAN